MNMDQIYQLINQQEQDWAMRQNPQMGGMGSMGNFGGYLMDLIQGNPENPQFQNQILGYYLDSMNPRNQMQDWLGLQQFQYGQTQDQLNTALSLAMSGDEGLAGYGINILQGIMPEAFESHMGEPPSYHDFIRQDASKFLHGMEHPDRDDYRWYSQLMNAPDEMIDLYEQPVSYGERFGAMEGSGILNALRVAANPLTPFLSFLPGVTGAEDIKRSRTGYSL